MLQTATGAQTFKMFAAEHLSTVQEALSSNALQYAIEVLQRQDPTETARQSLSRQICHSIRDADLRPGERFSCVEEYSAGMSGLGTIRPDYKHWFPIFAVSHLEVVRESHAEDVAGSLRNTSIWQDAFLNMRGLIEDFGRHHEMFLRWSGMRGSRDGVQRLNFAAAEECQRYMLLVAREL